MNDQASAPAPDPDADAIAIVQGIAASQRAGYRRQFPLEYDSGFIAGMRDKVKPSSRYPPDFGAWSVERKNGWFAGWNEGYTRP